MELFAADGHDAGGCERVTGKSGMRPSFPARTGMHPGYGDRAVKDHDFPARTGIIRSFAERRENWEGFPRAHGEQERPARDEAGHDLMNCSASS